MRHFTIILCIFVKIVNGTNFIDPVDLKNQANRKDCAMSDLQYSIKRDVPEDLLTYMTTTAVSEMECAFLCYSKVDFCHSVVYDEKGRCHFSHTNRKSCKTPGFMQGPTFLRYGKRTIQCLQCTRTKKTGFWSKQQMVQEKIRKYRMDPFSSQAVLGGPRLPSNDSQIKSLKYVKTGMKPKKFLPTHRKKKPKTTPTIRGSTTLRSGKITIFGTPKPNILRSVIWHPKTQTTPSTTTPKPAMLTSRPRVTTTIYRPAPPRGTPTIRITTNPKIPNKWWKPKLPAPPSSRRDPPKFLLPYHFLPITKQPRITKKVTSSQPRPSPLDRIKQEISIIDSHFQKLKNHRRRRPKASRNISFKSDKRRDPSVRPVTLKAFDKTIELNVDRTLSSPGTDAPSKTPEQAIKRLGVPKERTKKLVGKLFAENLKKEFEPKTKYVKNNKSGKRRRKPLKKSTLRFGGQVNKPLSRDAGIQKTKAIPATKAVIVRFGTLANKTAAIFSGGILGAVQAPTTVTPHSTGVTAYFGSLSKQSSKFSQTKPSPPPVRLPSAIPQVTVRPVLLSTLPPEWLGSPITLPSINRDDGQASHNSALTFYLGESVTHPANRRRINVQHAQSEFASRIRLQELWNETMKPIRLPGSPDLQNSVVFESPDHPNNPMDPVALSAAMQEVLSTVAIGPLEEIDPELVLMKQPYDHCLRGALLPCSYGIQEGCEIKQTRDGCWLCSCSYKNPAKGCFGSPYMDEKMRQDLLFKKRKCRNGNFAQSVVRYHRKKSKHLHQDRCVAIKHPYCGFAEDTLDEESQALCVINTPRGLRRHTRLPFGIFSAPALFQRRMDQLLAGLPGVVWFLDDICVTGSTEEEHLLNLERLFCHLLENGAKLKLSKCQFMRPSVQFLGHVLNEQGITALPNKLDAVQKLQRPCNRDDVKSFVSKANYCRKFVSNQATLLALLNDLLKKDVVWHWSSDCEKSFQALKKVLASPKLLVHYNPKFPVTLACDASPIGVGVVLSHIMPNGDELPIAFASETLTETRRRYSQIEKEAYAIIFGVRKFYQYLFGKRFTLITDHKPLTAIFGPKRGIPPMAVSRLQRWAIILTSYQYDIEYRNTKLHANADALSRLPVHCIMSSEAQVEDEVDTVLVQYVSKLPISAAEVAQESGEDPILSTVMEYVSKSWPNIVDKVELRPFWHRKDELTISNKCLFWQHRIVIPEKLQDVIVDEFHTAHPGMTRMKMLARQHVWWPGLDSAVERRVNNCDKCHENRNMPPTVVKKLHGRNPADPGKESIWTTLDHLWAIFGFW